MGATWVSSFRFWTDTIERTALSQFEPVQSDNWFLVGSVQIWVSSCQKFVRTKMPNQMSKSTRVEPSPSLPPSTSSKIFVITPIKILSLRYINNSSSFHQKFHHHSPSLHQSFRHHSINHSINHFATTLSITSIASIISLFHLHFRIFGCICIISIVYFDFIFQIVILFSFLVVFFTSF